MTNAKHGHVAGEYLRFIRGHVGYLKRRETITPDLWGEEDRGYTTPCWIWKQAPAHPLGYSRVQLRGHKLLAHRAMYEQEVGPIPEGLQIDHLCRQPACVNPAHLEPVTGIVNSRRGIHIKVTHDLVRAIRRADGSQRDIAARFGISHAHVGAIRRREWWKDVPDEAPH